MKKTIKAMMAKVFGGKSGTTARKTTLRVDGLEDRTVPTLLGHRTALICSTPVQATTANPGDTVQLSGAYMVGMFAGSGDLRYTSATRDGDLNLDLASVTLEVDLRGPMGDYETKVPGRFVGNDTVAFDMGRLGTAGYSVLPVRVMATLSSQADGRVGLGRADLTNRTELHMGPSNPIHTVRAPQKADLSIVLTGPATVTQGESATFSYTVSNRGPGTATNASSGFTFDGNTQYISHGTLAPGQTRTGTVTVTANNTGYKTVVMNIGGAQSDPNLSNNASAMTLNVLPSTADVSVTMTSLTNVTQGDYVTFTYRITNNGPATAKGVSATTTFTSYDVTANVGDLAPGQTRTGTMTMKAEAIGNQRSTVTVTSQTTDPNTTNNSFGYTVTVAEQGYQPQYSVAVKSIGSTDTAVKNEKNVTLLRFETYAGALTGTPRDALLTEATFTAAGATNMQNYTLWADTTGDGLVDTRVQSGVNSYNGYITFDSLIGGGYVTPAGQRTVFEVHGDVAASISSNTFQLAFATSRPDYLKVEDVATGESLSGINTDGTGAGEIVVVTTPSKTFTIKDQGNLYVTQSSTPVRTEWALGGETVTVARVQYRAEDEAMDVFEQVFEVTGTGAQSVERIELYLAGSNTPYAYALRSLDGFTAYTHNRQFEVRKGEVVEQIVKVRVKSDENGGVEGTTFQVTVKNVKARGVSSSNNAQPNDGDTLPEGEFFLGVDVAGPNRDIISQPRTVTMAMVDGVTNANPDADLTELGVGMVNVGQWQLNTASHTNYSSGADVWVGKKIVIDGNADNAIVENNFVFYNKADASFTVTGRAYTMDGVLITAPTITGRFRVIIDVPAHMQGMTTIGMGSSQTWVQRLNVLNKRVSATRASEVMMTLRTDLMEWESRDASGGAAFLGLYLPDAEVRSTRYVA